MFCQASQAQKTYVLRWSTDLPVIGIGLSASAGGWFLGKKTKAFDAETLARLQRDQLFAVDRKASYQWSQKAGKSSDRLFYSATLAPLLLLTSRDVRNEAGLVGLLYLETLCLNGGLTELCKNSVKRPRPFTYNPNAPMALKLRKDARKSFFSGHTSSTAASCFFAAKIWSDFNPGSKWKPLVWSTAASIPAITGLLRIRAGKHFFTDVAAGYLVGATIGCFIPYLHRSKSK